MKSNMFRKISASILLLVGIVAIGFLLRVFHIGSMPAGVTNDELSNFINAYSIAMTGKDIYGHAFPVMFQVGGWPVMPVPVYIDALVIRVLGLSVFSSRLPSVLLGGIGIFVVWDLVRRLFGDNRLAILAAGILAVSPWNVHFSRMGYDGVYAAAFLLFGIYWFSRVRASGRLFIPGLFFVLAMASYRAISVITLPVFGALVWYRWPEVKKNKSSLIAITLVFASIILTFFALWRVNVGIGNLGFTHEVLSGSSLTIQKDVDTEIEQSDAPLWLRRFYNNKPLYTLRQIRENYLHIFSPQFFFTSGEADSIYALWWRGQLYIIELPFLILGFYYLFRSSKRSAGLVLLFILISPLAAAISTPVYSMRALSMTYFLPIVIGGGILFVYGLVKKKGMWKYAFMGILTLGYLYCISSYLYQYHFRYKNYAAERWNKQDKDLALYVQKHKDAYDEVVLSRTGVYTFLQYAYWTHMDPALIQQTLTQGKPDDMRVENLHFVSICFHNEEPLDTFMKLSLLFITNDICHPESAPTEYIYVPKTIRYVWKIYDGRKMPL